MKRFYLILFLVCLIAGALDAQRTPELGIRAKDAATTGVLYFEDLTGNKLSHQAPASLTPYTLTWPDAITAGCLTANGSGTLTWQTCVSLPIDDSSTVLKGSADATKLVRFEVDGLTTATTRVATVPDANFTMAGINIPQFWTANQTYQANIYFDGLRDVGQALAPASNIYSNQIRIPAGPCFLAGMTTAAGAGLVYSQNSSCVTSAEMDGSGFELLGTGSFRVSGTQVIDSTRRLLNISTVVSSLIPSASATYSLGDSTATGEWFQLYVRQLPAVETIWPKNSVSDIGYNGAGGYFRNGYFQNITVSGTCTGCGSGITSINGFTNSTQSIVIGLSGSVPNVSSSAGVHTINIPYASFFQAGILSTGSQDINGDKYFRGSVLPGFTGTYSNGTSGLRWLETWANTGNFTTVNATSGAMSSLSVTGNITIGTIVGVFSGTGSVGTSGSRIGNGYFTNLDVSQFGSLTAYVGSGNFYNRTFAGSPSCAGVTDGWTGVDTFNLRIWVCIGGTARYATLF